MPGASFIFDLDGTLVDSLPGIEASIRAAVEKCLPGRPVPPIRDHIGPPIRLMLERLYPDRNSFQMDFLVSAFREHYDTRGCRESRLYPGVLEVLGELRAADCALFVLTNKPFAASLAILEETGIRSHFADVVSPDSIDPPFSNKTDGARFLKERFRLEPALTFLIGDGLDDAAAAEACGFAFFFASYGYGSALTTRTPAPVAVLQSFGEIPFHFAENTFL